MKWTEALEIGGNIAEIITALVAAVAYGRYVYSRWHKRIRLEYYLELQKGMSKGGDRGARSIVDLMAALKMTEAEILDAAFRSRRVKGTIPLVPMGAPLRMDLEYDAEGSN